MIKQVRRFTVSGQRRRAFAAALLIAAAVPLVKAQGQSGADSPGSIFKTDCATCHGDDGSGSALGKRLHAKDLRSAEVQSKPSAALAQTIRAGKNAMPAFGGKLDAEKIQKLVDYIHRFARHAPSAAAKH